MIRRAALLLAALLAASAVSGSEDTRSQISGEEMLTRYSVEEKARCHSICLALLIEASDRLVECTADRKSEECRLATVPLIRKAYYRQAECLLFGATYARDLGPL